MNIFRFLGDSSHVLAIIILLLKMWKSKSCSGKTPLTVSKLYYRLYSFGPNITVLRVFNL